MMVLNVLKYWFNSIAEINDGFDKC